MIGRPSRLGEPVPVDAALEHVFGVTPLAELERFRAPAPAQRPAPLPYLREDRWAFDLGLAVELNGAVVARTTARHLHWTRRRWSPT